MNFQKLDLNLLVALDALLDERHVGRAAERLRVSQPTMSVALARLRAHYKDDLLVRQGREMAPTAFAESLQPRLRQFVIETRGLASAGVEFDIANTSRRFAVVLGESPARLYLPGLLRRMRQAAPASTLTCLNVTNASIRMFDGGEIDLMLMPSGQWLTDDDRSWTERHPSELVLEDQRVCLAWARNDAVSDPVTLAQIREAGVISPSFVSNDTRAPEGRPLTRYYGAEFPVVAELPPSAIGAALVGSPHVALIGRRPARYEAGMLDVKIVELPPGLAKSVPLHLYWHRRNAADPAVAWLRALLRAEMTDYRG